MDTKESSILDKILKPYRCGRCGNTFTESKRLSRHLLLKHNVSESLFICPFRNKYFDIKSIRKRLCKKPKYKI